MGTCKWLKSSSFRIQEPKDHEGPMPVAAAGTRGQGAWGSVVMPRQTSRVFSLATFFTYIISLKCYNSIGWQVFHCWGNRMRAAGLLDFMELRQLDGINDSVAFIIRGLGLELTDLRCN